MILRIGLLFIVLQSVLLCAAVQAEPGVSKGFTSLSCSVLQPVDSDDDNDLFQNNPDNDADLQHVDNSIVLATAFVVYGFLPIHNRPQSRQIDSNAIRGPPSLA